MVNSEELFKQLNILTLTSQYIDSLLEFVLENRILFTTNRDTHDLTTRNCFDLRLPRVNLTRMQRGVVYSGCRVFNTLPVRIKSLSENPRHFKKKKNCKRYLMDQSVYNLEEFYQLT